MSRERDDSHDPERTPPSGVPAIIAAAGEQAAAQYRAFFEGDSLRPSTRENYRYQVGRFLRWAERRGLTLAAVSHAETAAYLQEIRDELTPGSVIGHRTALRSFFRHLAEAAVLPDNPFLDPGRRAGTAEDPGAFPLLSVMAMLAHMEERSRERIFSEEGIAFKLLEFVRWRDGRHCTQCGAPAEDSVPGTEDASRPFRCPACGRTYDVTDGSPFAGSPLPLREGLSLLFQRYLSDEPTPDRGIGGEAAHQLAERIQASLACAGLSPGEALRWALERRDRELAQREIARDIIECAELQTARDALLKAKAEGATVADLPPDVTIEEAIERLEARMAEHDRYLIAEEDGYLVYRWPEAGAAASPEPGASVSGAEREAADGY